MADTPAPAEAAADATAAPATAKKKSKLLVIIAAAILLLGAAGGGAYFFMAGGEDAEETAAEDGKATAGAKGKDKKKKNEKPKGPAIYAKFDPPFVVNFEAKGLMRFLQVGAEVMTRDQPTADLIKLNDPRLRNDLLLLLGSQTYETISTREGKEKLRLDALQVVANVVAAEGGDAKHVEQLYFTSFVMQ